MAPRKQVYGKRSTHVYSNFAGFTSPVKPRKAIEEITVVEVAAELGKLKVHDATSEGFSQHQSPVRNPLSTRDGNTVPRRTISRRSLTGECESPEAKGKTRQMAPRSKQKSAPAADKNDKTDATADLTITIGGGEDIAPLHTPAGAKRNEQELAASFQALALPSDKDNPSIPASSANVVPQPEDPRLARSDIMTRDIPHQASNIFTKHASSLLTLSSQPLASFASWSNELSSHFSVTKIAEASFGEVYRLSLLRPHPTLGRADESVLKIIALKPPKAARRKLTKAARKRIEMMSDPEDVASEVRLMQRMTTIPGYTMFRECCILQGRPGDSFVSAWHAWNEVQEGKGKDASFFPDPGKKASYTEEQLWAVVEMQDAGTDLENVEIKDIWTTWDVFWGVVLALGKGEDAVGFEHRDLHMGNICVSKRKNLLGAEPGYDWAKIDPTRKVGFTGIETTLIDYTISRAEITSGPRGEDADVAFLDLENDLSIFEGDAEEEYQYEIYRHMRAAMYLDDPLADLYERWEEAENSGRTWRGYHPQTNLVWLHFVLHQLLEKMEWPGSRVRRSSDDTADPTSNKATQLEHALLRLQTLLDPGELPRSGLRSASDIVQLAMREEWLDEQDVKGSASSRGSKKEAKRKARVVDDQRKRNVR